MGTLLMLAVAMAASIAVLVCITRAVKGSKPCPLQGNRLYDVLDNIHPPRNKHLL
jgi:hypothetical protein